MNVNTGELRKLAELSDADLLRSGGDFIPVPSNLICAKEINKGQVKLSKKDLIVKLHKLKELYFNLKTSKSRKRLSKKIIKLERKIERIN